MIQPAFRTKFGKIILHDSLTYMRDQVKDESVDLIITSPPFGLVRKKDYGNVDADQYLQWFLPFAIEFFRILKPSGSFVLDIGGSWIPGQPTRSLYHFELLITLCREAKFHLAQEFYWWNPAKLPTPAEWVTVRRVRVKDALNTVFWLSKTPWPKASNRRVLAPYSDSMRDLLKNGYKAKLRPSGHDISDKFQRDNGAAIPPNLLAIPNTESNSNYLRYCKEIGVKPHSARFPAQLPEFFIRFLTDVDDMVFDPFAGSCVTGEVCERLERNWICCEIVDHHVQGAIGRFNGAQGMSTKRADPVFYKIYSSSSLWNGAVRGLFDDRLSEDGGKKRVIRSYQSRKLETSKTVKEKKGKYISGQKPKTKA